MSGSTTKDAGVALLALSTTALGAVVGVLAPSPTSN